MKNLPTLALQTLTFCALLSGCSAPLAEDPLDDALATPPELLSSVRASTPDMLAYEPAFRLWTDGANKTRWVDLPDGEVIDSSDMDRWDFPVGTTLYKELRYDGVPVETRVSHRFGADAGDWWYAAYHWDADGSDAVHVPAGMVDANATGADIPSEGACRSCHGSTPRPLGISAIQLAHDGDGLTLERLLEADRLSDPPSDEVALAGDAPTLAALGYLHANCGHCHSDDGIQLAQPLRLELRAYETLQDSGAMTTAVDVPAANGTLRIAPGAPDESYVAQRIADQSMPPLGHEQLDEGGLALVQAWIRDLTPERAATP